MMYNQDFANNLANNSIDVNIYRKKDPEQQYGGFGYAMNNLLRNIGNNMGRNNMFGGESFLPTGRPAQSPFNTIGSVGLPFIADMIWGNKYE